MKQPGVLTGNGSPTIMRIRGPGTVGSIGYVLTAVTIPYGFPVPKTLPGVLIPNGLAYSENAQIWIREVRGDSIVQLTFEGRNFSPDWSSDGGMLVYVKSPCTDIPCGTWMYKLDAPPEPIIPY